MGGPLRVMLVYGTRPEAIKLAPLVTAMRDDERFNPIVVVTGQHREMLDQVHDFFGIVPDDDLDIHSPGQTLNHRGPPARRRRGPGRHHLRLRRGARRLLPRDPGSSR